MGDDDGFNSLGNRESLFTASGSSQGTHEDLAVWKKMQEIPAENELVSVRHTLPITVVSPSTSVGATSTMRSSSGALLDNAEMAQSMQQSGGVGKPFKPLPSRDKDKVVPPPPPDMEELE